MGLMVCEVSLDGQQATALTLVEVMMAQWVDTGGETILGEYVLLMLIISLSLEC